MKKYIKILSLLLALLMLLGATGCSKMTGEWISEREYYYYDEDGNWTKLTDEDKIAELGGNAANKSDKDKEDKNDKIDASNLQVLTDYMGNDGWEKTFDHKNMSIESLHADVLLDDYRVRRTDMADGYVTYKVDGVGEILLQYSFGVGDRFASEPVVTVSKDGEKWDVVKPQSTTYEQFNGDSWVKYVSYYGGIDTANQYVKVTLLNTAKHVYDPNLNFIQINGITEKLLGELGGYAEGISQAKTIYVDSKAGKDTNDGTSEDKPLKTLYAASQKSYAPGSKILLKAGQSFTGSLKIAGTGTEKAPITVSSYGKGAKPVINARGGAALSAGGEYINITGLKITNKTGSQGINITTCKPGATKGVKITKCEFEDINVNFTNTQHAACGVYAKAAGKEPAWFDGLTIEDNKFEHVARCGVVITSDWCSRSQKQEWGNKNDVAKGEYFGSKNVAVRSNTFNKTGGDVIFVTGLEGGVVEKNLVSNTALFRDAGEIHWAAIWAYGCTGTVFQYNEVYGNRGTNSGYDLQAFDADIANRDLIFQYNYSHDNDGGFMLFCSNDATTKGEEAIATTGTIVRYNLSVNDGCGQNLAVFDITSSIYDSQVYNNTIYCGVPTRLVCFANYDGGPDDSRNTVFKNNIFYAPSGTAITYRISRLKSALFENNVFYNIEPPVSPSITLKDNKNFDPQFVEGGAIGNGIEAMAKKYALKSGSQGLTSGIAIENNGGKDLLGNKVNDKLMGAIAK